MYTLVDLICDADILLHVVGMSSLQAETLPASYQTTPGPGEK